MEESKASFCSSKLSWAHGRTSAKFIDNLGKRLKIFASFALDPV